MIAARRQRSPDPSLLLSLSGWTPHRNGERAPTPQNQEAEQAPGFSFFSFPRTHTHTHTNALGKKGGGNGGRYIRRRAAWAHQSAVQNQLSTRYSEVVRTCTAPARDDIYPAFFQPSTTVGTPILSGKYLKVAKNYENN
jgi:hypothetical protein